MVSITGIVFKTFFFILNLCIFSYLYFVIVLIHTLETVKLNPKYFFDSLKKFWFHSQICFHNCSFINPWSLCYFSHCSFFMLVEDSSSFLFCFLFTKSGLQRLVGYFFTEKNALVHITKLLWFYSIHVCSAICLVVGKLQILTLA